jgi:hypothetical protein
MHFATPRRSVNAKATFNWASCSTIRHIHAVSVTLVPSTRSTNEKKFLLPLVVRFLKVPPSNIQKLK